MSGPGTRADPAATGPRLARAGGVMALGTLASRATGFLRTVAIAAALGISGTRLASGSQVAGVADPYNVANTTPNIIYDLLLGGILSSVLVPVLVRAVREDDDGGEGFAGSLVTLVTLVLSAVVALAVLLAPVIIGLYLGTDASASRDLAVTFSRFFLPQILFYGLSAVIGAILQVRGRFAAPMFAPVLNNLVVIATALAFISLPGPRPPTAAGLTSAQLWTLGLGTTAGVVIMTLALLPALVRSGLRPRLQLDLAHPGLRRAGRLAGWAAAYVVVTQVGFVVVVRLASGAYDGAYTVYSNAYLLFQLPHAVVTVSVVTALLPRLSGHAVDGAPARMSADLARGLRLVAVVLVPAAVGLFVLAPQVAVAVFAHGAAAAGNGPAQIGQVLAAFALALLPFSAFQLLLRGFYALADSRTPALLATVVVAVNLAGAALAAGTSTGNTRVVGLALAFGASYAVGGVAAAGLLRRRLGLLHGRRSLRLVVRVGLAAGLGGTLAWVVARGLREALGAGALSAAVAAAAAGVLGGLLYLGAAHRMRVHELSQLVGSLRR